MAAPAAMPSAPPDRTDGNTDPDHDRRPAAAESRHRLPPARRHLAYRQLSAAPRRVSPMRGVPAGRRARRAGLEHGAGGRFARADGACAAAAADARRARDGDRAARRQRRQSQAARSDDRAPGRAAWQGGRRRAAVLRFSTAVSSSRDSQAAGQTGLGGRRGGGRSGGGNTPPNATATPNSGTSYRLSATPRAAHRPGAVEGRRHRPAERPRRARFAGAPRRHPGRQYRPRDRHPQTTRRPAANAGR